MAPKCQVKPKPPPLRTIKVTVVQSGIAEPFSIVEEATFNEATWSRIDDGNHELILKGTDASGMLRFKSCGESAPEEFFLVALGVNTSKPGRWCDLKVDLDETETAASIHRNYHAPECDEHSTKNEHSWVKTLKSAQKTVISVQYYTDQHEDDQGTLRGVIITIT